MIRRILVMLDATTASRRILPWVRRLLAATGGEVRLLAVLPPARAVVTGTRTVTYADQREDADRRAMDFMLNAFAACLHDDGLAVSSEIRFGDPGRSVLDAARAWGAEAIAVVDVPARGLMRWFSRGIVDEIVRDATVPVLVARTGQRAV